MSAPVRFLALVVVGWIGVRTASLGMLPGAQAFTLREKPAGAQSAVEPSPLAPPPTTAFAELAPPPPATVPVMVLPNGQQVAFVGGAPAYPFPYYLPASAAPASLPMRYAAMPAASPQALTPLPPVGEPQFYAPIPQLDEWPLSRMASASMPPRSSVVAVPQQSVAPPLVRPKLDRLQVAAWALLRDRQGLFAGPPSLASGGTLGGSQAGTRVTYNFSRYIAATGRYSSALERKGGEVALGVKLTPVQGIPLALTIERRQRLGKYSGGRNDFAMLFEGGVYQRPMPWSFSLDAWWQGGVVGLESRDLFFDGSAAVTRPVYGRLSAGLGVWGGAQPGLSRLDVGPRLSLQVRPNMKVHLDWRQRLAGNALPASGPAVTLAGDF